MSIFLSLVGWGQRLREERERLGLNQDECGAIGGVKRQAQYRYEVGKASPDLDYLARIESAGVDVHYLLSGLKQLAPADQEAYMWAARTVKEIETRNGAELTDRLRAHMTALLWAKVTGGGRPEKKDVQALVQELIDAEKF